MHADKTFEAVFKRNLTRRHPTLGTNRICFKHFFVRRAAPKNGDRESVLPAYKELDALVKKIKARGDRLLVGVTGSIACGKTTVCGMLQSLGSPLIDFDLIARQVVAPGARVLGRIVDYFGEGVLLPEGGLDREKLSGIVFYDAEKRKKLERLTHPAIYEAFCAQLARMSEQYPDAIIQAAVPLLIESNLQFIFDRIVVVYLSPHLQIKRLIERDKIPPEKAAMKIQSQLSIDEKVGFADYVIRNDGSLEETRRQVEAVWTSLKALQKVRSS